ncbi:MAG: cellobiose phosphorylase [Candidatus Omnitrophica bacterium]|nr:cellobiose phosphorylase [Candidatus Omnitrophota bacterium]MDD5770737.1 cellobiose phosphorylase [Candidatus Omnitrophota bacterium]
MEKTLYRFTDDSGSFLSSCAHKFKSLYFPLGNERIMSSITADLHGDIKSGQGSFLLAPVSRIDLMNLRSSRNFWIYMGPGRVWSATGVSRDMCNISRDEFFLEAGLLWQKVTRRNKRMGIEAQIVSFVPSDGEPVEIMRVEVTNISRKTSSFIPTAAIPMYNRGANNIRDHRHVTSLLQRVALHKFGVIFNPTLSFDESGHRPNKDNYFILGWDDKFLPPARIYPTQDGFCGDSGDLEEPEAVFKNILPGKNNIQGREAMGGLGFKKAFLRPGQSKIYTVIMGITDKPVQVDRLIAKFNHPRKVASALEKNRVHWGSLSRRINIATHNGDFDNWLRWVNIQPTLRKIFGCSFLPDFDYGKGGRGWRDLWQDCLGLILNDPGKVRELLINNFCGVKIDGSNATIIGSSPGEFIADRNNISRVWMDHGVWPLVTLDLYIHETGDLGILFEQTSYFRNHEIKRASQIDHNWTAACGNKLKTGKGKVYSGSILEHILAQNLVQFFNVGSHNHIRLEGADWNDGLDMAGENGESVAFSAMYANNLETLSGLLLKSGRKNVELAEELGILFSGLDYEDVQAKRKILDKYLSRTASFLSGRKISMDVSRLSSELKRRSAWIKQHIRSTEYLKEGFFNGYYDNRKRRLEGKRSGHMQMTLTGQVFAIMAGIPDRRQLRRILENVDRYLVDKKTGGVHLNTDFKREQLDLGRAFSFSYGDKENGAVFSHMAVMFGYALYKQGYARQAWKIIDSLYRMALDTSKSKIYPCLPEYFDLDGRGMYSYLTGSASWFILTMLTQAFGVRGSNGDLMIEPKLTSGNFCGKEKVSIERDFAGRRIKVEFLNPGRLDYGEYKIVRAYLNHKSLPVDKRSCLVFSREVILDLPARGTNLIEIHLAR